MAELTAVAMSAAAVGTSGSPMLGMLGSPGDLACSGAWCSGDWAVFPAGVVPDAEPCEEPVPLGAVALPDDAPLPETRLASVGFMACGSTLGALEVPDALADSVPDGALAARGISGSWCGSAFGPSPVIPW
ncbi:hypothetical protein P5V34_00635 [Mycobacteroides abscessus subsp. abscessus]|uniref:hypothetical protein n=1 Tax=Mycobacteroides abscessus TaxID=36809 RepID=UPI00266D8523|nr:hypothetical protein [Mycobacteroides abscessus]MDO3012486.1 hypothetical protein [Mycobacteroides abscessus subsp. abscessus]